MISLLLDLASFLALVALLPAMYRVFINRNTLKDLSLSASILFSLSNFITIIAGFLSEAWICMIINSWWVIYNSIIIYFILRIRRKKQ